ncbi:MAG: DUF177 domain-containing protein [Candidatus Omnitrophota bacterium]
MKIDPRQIPSGGLIISEEFTSRGLDLDTEIIHFRPLIKVRAEVTKISGAVLARLLIDAMFFGSCSRCLNEFERKYTKQIQIHYPVGKTESEIILDPDIREEIILDYPIKPLCSDSCKGLCPKCGANLNEGGCTCGST